MQKRQCLNFSPISKFSTIKDYNWNLQWHAKYLKNFQSSFKLIHCRTHCRITVYIFCLFTTTTPSATTTSTTTTATTLTKSKWRKYTIEGWAWSLYCRKSTYNALIKDLIRASFSEEIFFAHKWVFFQVMELQLYFLRNKVGDKDRDR